MIDWLSYSEDFSKNSVSIRQALFHDDIEICIGAAIILGRYKDKSALPFLFRAFLTTNIEKANAVAWSLGEIGHSSALPFLTEAVGANFVVKSAIVALGKIACTDALSTLLENLGHQDESVRALCAWSIGQLQDESSKLWIKIALNHLKNQLVYEKSRKVKLVICVTNSKLEALLSNKI